MKKLVITAIIATLILSVSVFANLPPVAVCHDVTVAAEENCEAYANINDGSYDPDGDPITTSQDPPGPYPLGDTLVTLTVTDDSGETDSCQATVTVMDVDPPTLTCPDNVTVALESPDGTVVPLQATATDNCTSDPVITSDELLIYPSGVTTVTFTATDESGNSTSCSMTVTVLGLPVTIDIKPMSCPNPLNLKSKGVLPVAILGTEDFDVTQIDPATVRLSREGVGVGVCPLRWAYEDVATPFVGELCDCHDLGPDGLMDLTLKFNIPELVAVLELDNVAGQTIPLTLTGNLMEEFGGTPISGGDCVIVLE
jgi:hypothetical protein